MIDCNSICDDRTISFDSPTVASGRRSRSSGAGMHDERSSYLLHLWKSGDEDAAHAIYDRYVARLIGLARTRLSPQLKRRVDADDVVQAAYHSFFRQARDDRYELNKAGDLWRLLAAITLNKLHKHVEFHGAAKRSFSAEDSVSTGAPDDSALPRLGEAVDTEPTADEAAAVVDEVEAVLSDLEPLHRRIVQLGLQGEEVEAIASEVQRSQRTVRRTLEKVRERLWSRFATTEN